MTIFTDKRLKHNSPVIAVVHEDTQERTIINIAVPADQNILTTDEDKVEKNQHLALEIKRAKVIPIPTGLLGTISGNGKVWCVRLSLPDIFGSAQLSAILSTAHILRKV